MDFCNLINNNHIPYYKILLTTNMDKDMININKNIKINNFYQLLFLSCLLIKFLNKNKNNKIKNNNY